MKIRVLVVEDEPPIQRSICQKIEESNENFKVIAAIDNGKDAIQYLIEHPVDVMFVDMNLPIVSGKEILKFCYSEKLPVLPVVLSGYTDFEYVKCAVANHAVDYLLKPLNQSGTDYPITKNRGKNPETAAGRKGSKSDRCGKRAPHIANKRDPSGNGSFI